MAFQAACSANYVAIDNVTSGTETLVSGSADGLYSGNGYTVERTIFVSNSGFEFDTNRWQIVDSPGVSSLPTTLATFSYNSVNGSFGDIWDSVYPDEAAVSAHADGISFQYSAVDFNPNATVGYQVRVTTDSGYDQTFTLDTNSTVFKSRDFIKGADGDDFDTASNIQLEFFRDAPANGGLFQLRGNISVTPEPGAMVMFGCIATAFGFRRRR